MTISEGGKTIGRHQIEGVEDRKRAAVPTEPGLEPPGVLAIASADTERGRFKLEFIPVSLRVSASTGELYGHKIMLVTK
jgi:hypothetical protein